VVIGTALVITSLIFQIYPSISNNLQVISSSNTSPQVTTVIIPKASEDLASGNNFEPRLVVVLLGINNTVRWVNEAVTGNTVVADNQDDPIFWKATNSPSKSDLMLGKSFNFTFTKVGEFGYHGEPHPWLRGWVLVLPKSSENLTQTVVLNDTKIRSPCEMFSIPCPNSHSFIAQKFGSNIYIEKMTINGVDYYAIIHPSYSCLYPQTIGTACFEPDNIALLKMVGANELATLESHLDSTQIASVVAVKMVKPHNPTGLKIQLTLKNIGITPITSLQAVLELNSNYTFDFKNITSSMPLEPGNSSSDTEALVGEESQSEFNPLWISGIANTVPFRFSENVKLSS